MLEIVRNNIIGNDTNFRLIIEWIADNHSFEIGSIDRISQDP